MNTIRPPKNPHSSPKTTPRIPVKKAYQIIIFLILLYGYTSTLHGQVSIPNPGFEEADPASTTGCTYWELESGLDQCHPDPTTFHSGKHSLHIVKTNPNGLGFFKQQFPFTSQTLTKYTVTCALKTKFTGPGQAALGCRVFDAHGNTITGYTALEVSGSHDWKTYTGEFYSDENAASLRIFGKIAGAGEAWFDDITLQETPLSTKKLSRKTARYITEYFGLIRTHTILEDTSHLAELEDRARRLCAGNPRRSYCHNILKRYITLNLKDGHSFFSTPADWKQMNSGSSMTATGLANFATARMLPENIAYLHVPTYASLDTALNRRYVDSLQFLIATLDAQDPIGWIIDISDNQGGNSFAMLPGLGPLLGNGICGYSISGDGSLRTRRYDNGWAGWDDRPLFQMTHPPYHLRTENPPTAILYGKPTGSSGEVVAISFRGKPNTRSFGQPTAGATTRVDNLRLSDGAYLNLACGYDMDRDQVVYKGPVQPDVVTGDQGEALREAVKWVKEVSK